MRTRWLVLALPLVLVLSACGGGDSAGDGAEPAPSADEPGEEAPPAGDGEPVELTLALFGGFGLEPIVEEYMDLNPHVTINLQLSEYGDHHDALTTALAAGTGGPDIAAIEVGFVAGYVNQASAFANIQELAGDGLAEVQGRYLDWKWSQATTLDGSHTIGVPTDIGGLGMCYRVDLFEEAGLPTDRDEVSALWADSWDSFLDVGEQYVAATGRGFADNPNNLWNAVVNQDPATFYDAEGNLVYDSSPQVQKAWDIVTQAIERGVQSDIAAWSPEWEAGMSDGSFAVLTCPAWMMGYIMSVAPGTEGMWDIATIPEGGGNWGGSHLGILAQSENQAAAYDFIQWALAPEQQLKVFIENGNFPSIPALFDTPEVREFSNEFFNNAPVGQIYAENALDVVSQNTGPDYDFIDQELQNGLGRVADGAETPDEAWESSLENIRRDIG